MKKRLKLLIWEEEAEEPTQVEIEVEAGDALSTKPRLSVTTTTILDISLTNVQTEMMEQVRRNRRER